MPANLTMADGYLTQEWSEDGTSHTRRFAMAIFNEPAWHREGKVNDANLTNVLDQVDPEGRMNEWMEPTGAFNSQTGEYEPNGCADLFRWSLDAEGKDRVRVNNKPVNAGLYTLEEWRSYNDRDAFFTDSPGFEVVNPAMVTRRLTDILTENGEQLNLESFLFLGDHGSDGFAFTVKAGAWDADIARKMGTPTDVYLTVYIRPDENMVVLLSPTVVVCSNTLRMAMSNSFRKARVSHARGARDRIAQTVAEVWDRNREAMRIQQESADLLLTVGMNDADFRSMLEYTYPQTERPDEGNVRGVMTLDDKLEVWNRNENRRQRDLDTLTEIWMNPDDKREWSGVTPEIEGSFLSGLQVVSAFETKKDYRKGSAYYRDLLVGNRANALDRCFEYAQVVSANNAGNVSDDLQPSNSSVKSVTAHLATFSAN